MLLAGAALVSAIPAPAEAQSAYTLYMRVLGRERELRDSTRVTVAQLRRTVQSYENVVRRFPRSGYADNALWQAANLSLLAYDKFGQTLDRGTALRLLGHLRDGYPSSSLVPRAEETIHRVEARSPAPGPKADAPARAAATSGRTPPGPDTGDAERAEGVSTDRLVTIKEITRTAIPDGVRFSIEMDGESLYHTERLENPRRVFFDLKGTRAAEPLRDARLAFDDDVVREVRLGRHPKNTTRVVMDLDGVEDYTVFTLYNPFRLVIDFRRAAPAAVSRGAAPGSPLPAALPRPGLAEEPRRALNAEPAAVPAGRESLPLVSRPVAAPSPAAPDANSNGQFSLSRQLGLGVSRIVLDAGHGGHDPGARANGINEAELVLDVTLRLKTLLEKQPGIEVALTRDGDEFIPLEERTAIANRQGADLFLSIHANASRNTKARGIETYFLNFASNPEAEAVAARENSASARSMHSLPEIVRAIALNNKIDESRDFAEMVQKSMIRKLRARSAQVRDLGVKQAPFVVLIGAGMPSVLAEISFVTHRQEGALLKTAAYRQQIAEALFDAIVRYQQSLKGVRAVAARE
jgi:N-acetylmuramoyl-L-alanine amidase